MTEVSPLRGMLAHEVPALDSPQLMEFRGELARQGKRPPSNDRVIGAMCLAALEELENNRDFQQTIGDLIALRPNEPPSQQVGDFRAVTQTELLSDDPDFPRGNDYTQPAAWQRPLRQLADRYLAVEFDSVANEERSERLATNLLFRKVQTNVPERALPVEYVMQSRRQRFAEGVHWLDIGCGIMESQSLLHHKAQYGMPPATVVDTDEQPDKRSTQRLQRLLEQDSIIRDSVGIDLADAYDSNTYSWSRGSLRPSELANKRFMDRFVDLAQQRLQTEESVNPARFFCGDIMSDDDVAELQKKHGQEKFEIVSILTMAHQLEPAERPKLLQRAAELTADNGLVVISDFTRLRSKRQSTPKHLSFYKHWHLPFRYRSFIWDMTERDRGLQEILRARTSRCDVLQMTDPAFATTTAD